MFSCLPPTSSLSFVFNYHELESFCLLRQLTLTSMYKSWLFLISVTQFCLMTAHIHGLHPAPPLWGAPLPAAGEAHEPKASEVTSTNGELQQMLWGIGGYSLLHVQRCWSPFSTPRLSGKLFQGLPAWVWITEDNGFVSAM